MIPVRDLAARINAVATNAAMRAQRPAQTGGKAEFLGAMHVLDNASSARYGTQHGAKASDMVLEAYDSSTVAKYMLQGATKRAASADDAAAGQRLIADVRAGMPLIDQSRGELATFINRLTGRAHGSDAGMQQALDSVGTRLGEAKKLMLA